MVKATIYIFLISQKRNNLQPPSSLPSTKTEAGSLPATLLSLFHYASKYTHSLASNLFAHSIDPSHTPHVQKQANKCIHSCSSNVFEETWLYACWRSSGDISPGYFTPSLLASSRNASLVLCWRCWLSNIWVLSSIFLAHFCDEFMYMCLEIIDLLKAVDAFERYLRRG